MQFFNYVDDVLRWPGQIEEIAWPGLQALARSVTQVFEIDNSFDASPGELPTAERIERARRAEAAALAVSPEITNSQGGSYGSGEDRDKAEHDESDWRQPLGCGASPARS